MGNVDTFDQGAKILQNVDVSSIVTGLALGIAEAQESLDNNSVKQIIRLSETKVAGKSLLELGFVPAFYSFDYADVSASISLKMAVKEEIAVDLSIEYDSSKKKGYTDEHIQKIENSYKEEKYRDFKSSRKYWTTLSNEHTLKVNETNVTTSNKTGSIERVEETSDRLSFDSKVERVDSLIIDTKDVVQKDITENVNVHNYLGYGMLSMVDYYTEDIGIVKIKNYSSLSITITDNSNPTLLKKIIGNTLIACLNSISSSVFKMGLKDKDKFSVYFDFSKHHPIDFAYSQGTSPKNTDQLREKLRALALIMKADSDVKVKITGHTDSVSSDKFNEDLGLKRAKGVANYLQALGVNASQITEVLTEGEKEAKAAVGNDKKDANYRKAVIEVDTNGNEYIFVEGGDFNYTDSDPVIVAANWSTTNSGIFSKYKKLVANINKVINVESGSDLISSNTIKTLSDINTQFVTSNKFFSQVSGDVVYTLRKDAKIEYTLYSNESEEIIIEDKSTNTQNTQNSDESLEIHKVINSQYFAKSDLTKIKDPKVTALSGSLDVRYARQFSMSVEGNASVSARMISVPPPTGLEQYIESLTGGSSNTTTN